MHRTSRAALLLVIALFAAACSGADGPTFADDEAAATTTSVPATTTTLADEGPVAALTGLPTDDEALAEAPVFALKIDNSPNGHPQIGINQADVVFEIKVENNLTRLMAAFHTELPPEAGPVRSARSSDVDVASALGNPVLSYSGSNPGVKAQLDAANAEGRLVPWPIDTGSRSDSAYRSGERSAPYNLIALPPGALANAPGDPGSPDPIFTYLSADEIDAPGAGGGLHLTTSASQPVWYVWSDDAGGWLRYQDDHPHLDSEGIQVAPPNVVVLEVDYTASAADADSPEAVSVGTGAALVARNGRIIEANWARETPTDPFLLTGRDGQEVGLVPGTTWVALAAEGTIEQLTAAQAADAVAAFGD